MFLISSIIVLPSDRWICDRFFRTVSVRSQQLVGEDKLQSSILVESGCFDVSRAAAAPPSMGSGRTFWFWTTVTLWLWVRGSVPGHSPAEPGLNCCWPQDVGRLTANANLLWTNVTKKHINFRNTTLSSFLYRNELFIQPGRSRLPWLPQCELCNSAKVKTISDLIS